MLILYTLLPVMKIVTFVLLTQRKNPLRSQTNLYDEHFIIYVLLMYSTCFYPDEGSLEICITLLLSFCLMYSKYAVMIFTSFASVSELLKKRKKSDSFILKNIYVCIRQFVYLLLKLS